jgi:hypothetical protein
MCGKNQVLATHKADKMNSKRVKKIFVYLCLVLAFVSCNKESGSYVVQNNDVQSDVIFKKMLFESFHEIKKVIESQNQSSRIKTKSNGSTTTNYIDDIINLSEESVKEILQPLLEPTKSLLLSRGIDISEFFTTDDDPDIILYGLFATYWEWETGNIESSEYLSPIAECALVALGIGDLAYVFFNNSMSTKAAMSVFKKLASRAISGWIGLAITVGQFAYCLANSDTPEVFIDFLNNGTSPDEEFIPDSNTMLEEEEEEFNLVF